jgi:hypothetical protein
VNATEEQATDTDLASLRHVLRDCSDEQLAKFIAYNATTPILALLEQLDGDTRAVFLQNCLDRHPDWFPNVRASVLPLLPELELALAELDSVVVDVAGGRIDRPAGWSKVKEICSTWPDLVATRLYTHYANSLAALGVSDPT